MLKENDIISKVLLTVSQYRVLNKLQDAVVSNEYSPSSKLFTRLLVWKCSLITETLKINEWDSKLSSSRVVFHKLAQDPDMEVPWHDLDKESAYYEPKLAVVKRSRSRLVKKLLPRESTADPLTSESNESSLSVLNIELIESIILDVDRIFPGKELFHNINVKKDLVQVLYIWSKCNPQTGYKQGLHEILGLIYLELFQESVEIPSTNTISAEDKSVLALYDIRYILHDVFTIFNKFVGESDICSKFYQHELALLHCIEDFNMNLMKVDQLIHYNLISKLKVESQLWIIRYFRLLLSRELDLLENTSFLWDKFVVLDLKSIPEVLSYMIIVLLINIKTPLVTCDFSECLSLLLHYPKEEYLPDSASVFRVFKYALKLLERKGNDLKLYEYGLKVNQKFNPNLKITMHLSGSARSSSSSRPSIDSLSLSESERPLEADLRQQKMAFEKYRMEMRLKKKVQLMVRNSS